ncbi:redoxin family protein [bacterium]|nr:redoxin family protein [bacterium]
MRPRALLLPGSLALVVLSCSSQEPERKAPGDAGAPPRAAAPPRDDAAEEAAIDSSTEPLPSGPVAARVLAMDTEGRIHTIGTSASKAFVLVFVSPRDPVSTSYLPAIEALAKRRSKEGVPVFAVVSSPDVTRADARELAKGHAPDVPVIFDASGELATRLRPARVPEAFLVGPDGRIVYRGRIDDAWREPTKANARVQHHDLDDATDALLAGKAVARPTTRAVGARFDAWEKNALPEKVTWARDIAPLAAMHCASCHRPGQVGPFPLLSYQDVSKRAKMVASVTASGYMPPWHAEPGFGRFRDEHRLSEREIALFRVWKDQGAPEGDAKDEPPPRAFPTEWALGQPDLVLSMPKPYDVAASGEDVYRAFALPTGLTEDRFVTAVEVRPGAPTLLHHAFIVLDNTGTVPRRERAEGSYGIPAFTDLGFVPVGSLGGWLPGLMPSFFPEGAARLLPKGSDVIFIAHYHPTGKVEQDRTTIGLYFAKKPPTHLIHNFTLSNPHIQIDAGDPRYRRTVRLNLPKEVRVVGIIPHMHLIGKEMKVTAKLPSGEVRPAVWIRYWDFRWQDQYIYEETQVYPPGTEIELEAVYDNSSVNPMNPSFPPKPVHLGWGTTDEMCECLLELLVSYRDGDDPNVEAGKLLESLYRRVVAPF